jgi:hypothetical protein
MKEIKTDKFFEENQIKANMIKEATGTLLIKAISGVINCLNLKKRLDRPAKSIPNPSAATKPPTIRRKEKSIASQNFEVTISSDNRAITFIGETKRISDARTILATCQTSNHITTAHHLICSLFLILPH